MFNRNALSCQLPIKRLLLRQQRTLLALLERHFTVRMIRRNPLITTVRLDRHIRTYRRTRTLLVQRKIIGRGGSERPVSSIKVCIVRSFLLLKCICCPVDTSPRSVVTALIKADTVTYPSFFAARCNRSYSSSVNRTCTAFSRGVKLHHPLPFCVSFGAILSFRCRIFRFSAENTSVPLRLSYFQFL